jgi:hypothetical protein
MGLMSIIFLSFREQERERETRKFGDNERLLWGWGSRKPCLRFRRFPGALVLLVEVKHMIRINSKCNFYGVREAVFE